MACCLLSPQSQGDVPATPRAVRKLVGVSHDLFVEFDVRTGEATRRSGLGIQQTSGVTRLAYDPTSKTLFGIDIQLQELVAISTEMASVHSAGRFRAGRITELTSDSATGVLYGFDNATSELVRVDPASGRALPLFYIDPVGALASDPHSNTLYAFDEPGLNLIRIDVLTGHQRTVGPIGFEVVSLWFDPLANRLYGAADVEGMGRLIVIDTTTGRGADLAELNAPLARGLAYDPKSEMLYGIRYDRLFLADPIPLLSEQVIVSIPRGPAGLAFAPERNTLFMATVPVGCCPHKILAVDRATGEHAQLDMTGYDWTRGLAFDARRQVLYGVDVPTGQLVSIDPDTGVGTVVGPTGVAVVRDLAFDRRGEKLYGTDGANLLVFDRSQGTAGVIGPTGFTDWYGLTFDDESGTLYGNRYGDNSLFTIDASTGRATRFRTMPSEDVRGLAFDSERHVLFAVELDGVYPRIFSGDASRGERRWFGSLRFRVTCLAYGQRRHVLYGVDLYNNRLMTIDPESGRSTSVGPVGFDGVSALAFDERKGKLYAFADATDEFIAIDPQTGRGTLIAQLEFDSIGNMAFDQGTRTLYGTDTRTRQLLVLDPRSGETRAVGELDVTGLRGLAYDARTGLLVGSSGRTLFSVDPATATMTELVTVTSPAGLDELVYAPDSDTLYATIGEQILILDTDTGAARFVGTLGFKDVQGMAFDPDSGTLYGVDADSYALITIDPATGEGTGFSPRIRPMGNGLAFDRGSGTLFSAGGNDLYRLDFSSFDWALVGDIGYWTVEGLASDSQAGVLFGAVRHSSELLGISPATGRGTSLGYVDHGMWGLTFDAERRLLWTTFGGQLATIDPGPLETSIVGRTGFGSAKALEFIELPDCNGNGVPDADDLESGFSGDCNGNDVPDECDISDGSSKDEFPSGRAPDGIPDECQTRYYDPVKAVKSSVRRGR
jgi:DNA-binding beta-propeller fold protein YncE